MKHDLRIEWGSDSVKTNGVEHNFTHDEKDREQLGRVIRRVFEQGKLARSRELCDLLEGINP